MLQRSLGLDKLSTQHFKEPPALAGTSLTGTLKTFNKLTGANPSRYNT